MTRQMADDEVLRVLHEVARDAAYEASVDPEDSGACERAEKVAQAHAAVAALQAERDALRNERDYYQRESERRREDYAATSAVFVANEAKCTERAERAESERDALRALSGQIVTDWIPANAQLAERAERAESALEALRGQVAGLGWIKPSDRLPEDGTECLVVAQYGSDPKPYVSVDTWQMQREAPLEFSSCTVETGLAWDDHDFLDVLLWRPIARPTAEELDAALLAIKERMG